MGHSLQSFLPFGIYKCTESRKTLQVLLDYVFVNASSLSLQLPVYALFTAKCGHIWDLCISSSQHKPILYMRNYT